MVAEAIVQLSEGHGSHCYAIPSSLEAKALDIVITSILPLFIDLCMCYLILDPTIHMDLHTTFLHLNY